MARYVGTCSRGIRCPIIKEGDDLAKIVVDSVLEARKDGFEIKEGETSAPKRYSSGSLIKAMENAGQQIDDNDELKSYYSKIVEYSEEKLEELSIQGSMTINNLKSEALKNVIIAKQHKAKSMNIEFICDIPKEIIDLQIDEIDLIRIVSILIDNAFEGASLARKKKVSLLVDSYGSEGYDIIIKNTIQESENTETSVNSWLIDGISSKSNKRGHGLAIVRELIKNNQQVGLTVIKEKNFVEVTLEVGEF